MPSILLALCILQQLCYTVCGGKGPSHPLHRPPVEIAALQQCPNLPQVQQKQCPNLKAMYDAQKKLFKQDRKLSDIINQHYPGNIDTKKAFPLETDASWLVSKYLNLYSSKWKIPLLVSYEMPYPKTGERAKRPKRFRIDLRVHTEHQADGEMDYHSNGFTKSHMSTADHFWKNSEEKDDYYNTFVMTNIAPHTQQLNERISKIDEEIRNRQSRYSRFGPIFVTSGNIVDEAHVEHPRKLNNEVVIPDRYYKIVIYCDGVTVKYEYWICLNEIEPNCYDATKGEVTKQDSTATITFENEKFKSPEFMIIYEEVCKTHDEH